jgi:Tfp pilus assembly protein PilW
MKGFLIAVIFLVIGGIAGGLLALGTGAGLGAAGGLIVGSQAGVCFAMETAKNDGLLTAEQVDKIIVDTVSTIRGKSSAGAAKDIEWIGSEKDCADMAAKMEAESAKSLK